MVLIVTLEAAYLLVSQMITPYLRHSSKNKIRLELLTAHILLESLGSTRDIKLTVSEKHFRSDFVKIIEKAKSYTLASEILPIIPCMLIELSGSP